MRRRDFIKVVAGSVATWPLTARAQQTERMRLIGVLMGYAEGDPAIQSEVMVFRAALTKLGWTEGVNLRIEFRWGGGDADRMKKFAKELVDLRPDVILGQTTPGGRGPCPRDADNSRRVRKRKRSCCQRFRRELCTSRRQHHRFSVASSEQGGKWLELLKEIAPRTRACGASFNPATAVPIQFLMPSIQAAASSSAVQVNTAPVHARDEIESVIAAQARDPSGGLILLPNIFSTVNRDRSLRWRPAPASQRLYQEHYTRRSGGLITYGPDFVRTVSPGSRLHRSRPQRPSLPTSSCKRRPSTSW